MVANAAQKLCLTIEWTNPIVVWHNFQKLPSPQRQWWLASRYEGCHVIGPLSHTWSSVTVAHTWIEDAIICQTLQAHCSSIFDMHPYPRLSSLNFPHFKEDNIRSAHAWIPNFLLLKYTSILLLGYYLWWIWAVGAVRQDPEHCKWGLQYPCSMLSATAAQNHIQAQKWSSPL